MMISPSFVQGLQSYLAHWLAQTAVLDDDAIRQLNPDFPNLLRVVELGLVLPETQTQTAELMLQCFFWVEQVGHVPQWQPWVALAVQCVPAAPNRLRFRLLKQLAQLQRLQYQLDTAVATLQEAEQLVYAPADKPLLAEIHMNLCQVYHLKRDYRTAEAYGRLALRHLPDNLPRLTAITLRTLGFMASEQGQYVQAEAYLQDSLNYAHLPQDRALTLNGLAITYQQQEQYDLALAIYDELLAMIDSATHTHLFTDVQLNKGGVLHSLGRLEAAESAFQAAEALLRQRSGLSFQKALAANHLGCVWRDQGQFAAAEASLRRSIQQFALAGAELYQANAWGNLAKLYARQGRQDEALVCLDEALRRADAYPDSAFAQNLQTSYTRLRDEWRDKWRDERRDGLPEV
ncbi:MAG: tetratricopeptide repeat protein [Chloroflexi bacterium]|nr:tetratricopeptide repeat protein [Chloroflexota bacterium]